MVATAHGDLRSILKSPKLNTLVGGETSVTAGDSMAIANGGSKVRHKTRMLFGIPRKRTLVRLGTRHVLCSVYHVNVL